MTKSLISFVLMAASTSAALDLPPRAHSDQAHSAFSENPERRFDFWIGTWRVDLRKHESNDQWVPLTQATARIYSILGGKALLELWDSNPIKGYSLRYYDPDRESWTLWLNWPQENKSQVGSLSGNFRHGRGVFKSTRQQPDGGEILSKYSFSDITPFSLRWDDAYSTDGGKTWRHSWIMEFTRLAAEPAWPIPHEQTPTLGEGTRCTLDRFRKYEPIAGRWTGTDDDDRAWNLEAWRILGGCAVMGLLQGPDESERFLFMTYNTAREAFELDVLDNQPSTRLRRLYADDGRVFKDEAGSWIWEYGETPGLTIIKQAGSEASISFRPQPSRP